MNFQVLITLSPVNTFSKLQIRLPCFGLDALKVSTFSQSVYSRVFKRNN